MIGIRRRRTKDIIGSYKDGHVRVPQHGNSHTEIFHGGQ